jgi:hypothetical protein
VEFNMGIGPDRRLRPRSKLAKQVRETDIYETTRAANEGELAACRTKIEAHAIKMKTAKNLGLRK